MWRIKRFIHIVILRRYWITAESPISNEWHNWPNRDLRRHEATDCWCGPDNGLIQDDDGDRYTVEHHSLDGREHRERV